MKRKFRSISSIKRWSFHKKKQLLSSFVCQSQERKEKQLTLEGSLGSLLSLCCQWSGAARNGTTPTLLSHARNILSFPCCRVIHPLKLLSLLFIIICLGGRKKATIGRQKGELPLNTNKRKVTQCPV